MDTDERKYIREATLRERAAAGGARGSESSEVLDRNRLMEALMQRTSHFRVGPKPTREEMNSR